MIHPAYIREKAVQLRVEKDLTIDEIAERLGISRQTIFCWVIDVPLKKPRRSTRGQRMGNTGMRLKYKRLRDEAYEDGFVLYDDLVNEPTFRDFVCMYVGEGSKRKRNEAAICNSDPNVIVLAEYWMRRFAKSRFSSLCSTTPTRTPTSCAAIGAACCESIRMRSVSSASRTATS